MFAIGDINIPGKLKLILSGFHESALMARRPPLRAIPEKKLSRPVHDSSSSTDQKKLGVA